MKLEKAAERVSAPQQVEEAWFGLCNEPHIADPT